MQILISMKTRKANTKAIFLILKTHKSMEDSTETSQSGKKLEFARIIEQVSNFKN